MAQHRPEVVEFLDACTKLITDAEEVPEKGESFAEGVIKKTQEMQAWAEKNNAFTRRMWDAVENMQAGVDRWLE